MYIIKNTMSRYSKINSLNDYNNLSNLVKSTYTDNEIHNLQYNERQEGDDEDNSYINYIEQSQFIGFDINDNLFVKEFFSKNVIDLISRKATLLLDGVDEYKRDIIIPDNRILEVMNTVYSSYKVSVGFDNRISNYDYVQNMIGDVIARIIYDVKNTLGYEQCTNKYTIWTTLYGDFNNEQIRSHAPIKIQKNRPNSFEFNMKY
jgi:hypothetical protein